MVESRRMSFKKASLAALAVTASALLAACGGAASSAAPTPTSAAGSGDAPVASTINLETPDLAISAYQRADVLGGEEVLLSELVGRHGKPVVLNFWAALCPPCRAEMPDIQAVFEQRAEDVTIVGVDIGPQQFLGSREDGKELLAALAISYPVGTTFDDNVVREFQVVGMPTTFFINADGSLLRAWSGLLNEAKLHEFIDDMLEN
jgi:thiol-disulfide isomerase/thioredoxin